LRFLAAGSAEVKTNVAVRCGAVVKKRRRGRSAVRCHLDSTATANEGRHMAVKPIPEGYNTLTAYLAVEDADRAIEFYKDAFGAEELFRMPAPDGRIGHAELQIGDSKLMLSDPFPQSNVRPPSERGGATASIFMYCEDVDSAFEQAKKAGATVEMELENMFWGDRFGTLVDPFGQVWSLSQHVEDLTPEEIAERSKAAMAQMGSS
jgi:PhnB protein